MCARHRVCISQGNLKVLPLQWESRVQGRQAIGKPAHNLLAPRGRSHPCRFLVKSGAELAGPEKPCPSVAALEGDGACSVVSAGSLPYLFDSPPLEEEGQGSRKSVGSSFSLGQREDKLCLGTRTLCFWGNEKTIRSPCVIVTRLLAIQMGKPGDTGHWLCRW